MSLTGLFFGSFNPIHIGHLLIAQHMINHTEISEVWFIVSPHNPFKEKKNLLAEHHRLQLVKIAIENEAFMKASDVEFKLPQPSYTVNTLVQLMEKYPQKSFALIMGYDNLVSLPKWKNSDYIVENFPVFVYPRLGENKAELPFDNKGRIVMTDAPVITISSTEIRKSIAENKISRFFFPEGVFNYVDEMNFYKNR
jgi:nicotinate-nucleotide adenylyltransferase